MESVIKYAMCQKKINTETLSLSLDVIFSIPHYIIIIALF